jgi:hypothetical protein
VAFSLMQRNAIPNDVGTMTLTLAGYLGAMRVGTLVELHTLDSAQSWQRYDGVATVPAGVDAVRLELELTDAPAGSVADVDELR